MNESDGQKDGHTNRQKDGLMDGQKDRWMDVWIDGWRDGLYWSFTHFWEEGSVKFLESLKSPLLIITTFQFVKSLW